MRTRYKNGSQQVSLTLLPEDAETLGKLAESDQLSLGTYCQMLLHVIAGRCRRYQAAASAAIGDKVDVPPDLDAGIQELRELIHAMPELRWLLGHAVLRGDEILTRIKQLEGLKIGRPMQREART